MRSVDGSPTTAFTVLECEGSRRLGSRPRRYLLTGQANGSLAMWDLTTAMDGLGQAPGTPCPILILSWVSALWFFLTFLALQPLFYKSLPPFLPQPRPQPTYLCSFSFSLTSSCSLPVTLI